MANELKFLRGSYTNWSTLQTKDANSFYIVEEKDGRLSLYLGEKFLCDGVSKADLTKAVSDLVNGAGKEYNTLGKLATKVQALEGVVDTSSTVATQITNAINALDSVASGKSANELVTVKVTETDGKLTNVAVTTNDIAKDSELTALKNAVGTGFTSTDTVAKAIDANKKAIAAEVARAKAAEQANAADITTLNGSDTTPGSVAKAVADAKKAIEGNLVDGDAKTLKAINTEIDTLIANSKTYSISKIQGGTEGLEENVREAYKLVDEYGTPVGETIKIYKDSSLKAVRLDGQTLKFTYIKTEGTEETVGVDVSTFLAESEFKNGLQVINHVVSVKLAAATKENTSATAESGKNFLELEGNVDGEKALAVRSVDTDSTILQKEIVVAGMEGQFGAGNYKNNDVIPAGTDIYTILQNILCKELYASPSNVTGTMTASIAEPTVTLDKSGTVEVGTLVTMNSATVANSTVATTGQSVNGMTYGYSEVDDDSVDSTATTISKSWTTAATGSNYKMSATLTGFTADATTHVQTVPETVNAQSMSKTVLGCVAEGSNTIKVSVTGDTFTGSVDGIGSVYHCSNLGNTDASKKTTAIAAITNQVSNTPTNRKSVTVTGAYKYFLGYSTNTTYDQFDSASVRALTTKTGNVTKDGTTTIVDATEIVSNGQSIVVACPSKYKLATIKNGLGASILENFSSKGRVTVTCGSISVEYMVYVYPITNGAKVAFKEVTLTNA